MSNTTTHTPLDKIPPSTQIQIEESPQQAKSLEAKKTLFDLVGISAGSGVDTKTFLSVAQDLLVTIHDYERELESLGARPTLFAPGTHGWTGTRRCFLCITEEGPDVEVMISLNIAVLGSDGLKALAESQKTVFEKPKAEGNEAPNPAATNLEVDKSKADELSCEFSRKTILEDVEEDETE